MKKQPDKGKITALYERLSHDDERAGESVSIENQKRILEDYAQKNGFTNIRHFTDDGVRGTTFKRPGLDAMLEEIRAGNVATVIIKDQSRIGRDVVEVGLLKRTFDEYHVRFIAANDNLDTANGFDIMSIFRDVINEWYVADTSRKIKTVFKSRMEKGLRCSGSVSYGYLASKENKGEWVIDEEAAAVVRRIFHSVVAGESIASMVLPQERSQECKVRMQSVDTFALLHPCTLTRYDRLMCRPHGALSLKGEPMNNETSKTSTPAAASLLTAKPDLVKNIGGTTFDIHIHFSETSRETFTDKVVRLIKNDSGDETA